MNTRTFKYFVIICFSMFMNRANADITGASVSPTQLQLSATGTSTFTANWQVSSDITHRAGTTSSVANLVNPSNGMTLATTGSMLSAAGGGPFSFNEIISLNAQQVINWQHQGISEVLLQRVFNDPGSGATATASMRLIIPSADQLSGARVSPSMNRLVGTNDNEISASWYITAGSGHLNGVVSTGARIINPRTSVTIATVGSTLSANGSGPFVLNERLVIDSALVQSLINQRLDRVILQRTFMDPAGGGTIDATMLLLLSRSQLSESREVVTGSLSVQDMRLEFASGNNMTLTNLNDSLQAKLILVHSGTGLLEGRWQVAEPGSTEGVPLYRTLALVRRNITGTQRSILNSPELPTARTGRYLLRFCITNRNMVTAGETTTEQCPIENLIVNAVYHVHGEFSSDIMKIKVLSPIQHLIDITTMFSWKPVSNARVYQLQVFKLVPAKDTLPSSEDSEETITPQFIIGMVLPAETTDTKLSELVRSRLQPDQRYLWRITAHDETGRLLGRSTDAGFIFTSRVQRP